MKFLSKIVVGLCVAASVSVTEAQIVKKFSPGSDLNILIPARPSPDDSSMLIPKISATSTLIVPTDISDTKVCDVDFRVDITSEFPIDCNVVLTGPDMTTTSTIVRNVCGGATNLIETFDDEADATLPLGYDGSLASFAFCDSGGVFVRPRTPLSVFDGLPTEGTWSLEIFNNLGGEAGRLNEWELIVTTGDCPCAGNPCGSPNTCTETEGATSYTCDCKLGFETSNDGSTCTDSRSVFPKTENLPIPGKGGTQSSTLSVPADTKICDVDFRVNITSEVTEVLNVVLTGPGGKTSSSIVQNVCGFTENLIEIFDDEADVALPLGYGGYGYGYEGDDALTPDIAICNDGGVSVRPGGLLSVFDGLPVRGDWTLEISSKEDDATLNEWALIVTTGNCPCAGNPCGESFICTETGDTTFTCLSTSSSAGGDPHFKTWTHDKYDFHGACDMVMLSNPDFDNNKGMDVHVRTKIRFSWSYIESAILKIGQDTLEIMGGDMRRYWINGVFGSSGKEFPIKIGGYTVDYVKKARGPSKQRIYTVDLGNGEKVILKTYKDFVSVDLMASEDGGSFAGSVGLMGSYATGDKLARDGETILSDPIAFGQEWQVLEAEPNLFHSLEGPQQPLQQCEMPAMRRLKGKKRLGQPEVFAEQPAGVVITHAAAEAACAHVPGEDRDVCIFDVLATNDVEMAGAY